MQSTVHNTGNNLFRVQLNLDIKQGNNYNYVEYQMINQLMTLKHI